MVRLPVMVVSGKRDKKEETKSENTVSNGHVDISKKNQTSKKNQLNEGKSHDIKMVSKKKSMNKKVNLKEKISLPILRKKQPCRDNATDNGGEFSLSTAQNQDMAFNNLVQVTPSRKSHLRHAVKEIWAGRFHKKKQSVEGKHANAHSGEKCCVDSHSTNTNGNKNDGDVHPISVKHSQEEYGVVWNDDHNNPIHHEGVPVDEDKNSNVVDSVYSSKYQINDDDSTRSTHRSLRELGFALWQKQASWEHKDPNRNNENRARTRTLSADYMISRN